MPSVPSRFGPYKVTEKLSESATTTLYRAEHERLFRKVLIKTPRGTLVQGSPLGLALAREATLLGKLDHPAIPAVFDYAVEETSAWVAQEDIAGVRLRAVLARAKKLEPAVAIAIALSLAEGLGHAHARSIVHRDVRPESVLLSREGRAVLVDFSAALDLRAPPSASPFDGSDRLSGPEYQAPEQILGETATARSDVFSLGILLYEMLAGQRPWDEGADGIKEIARRVRSEDPPPLASQGVLVSPTLERVVWRCLAKRPEDRYEDGSAASEALLEALDELSTTPVRVLVTRALRAAQLGEELPEGKAARKPVRKAPPPSLRPLVQALLGIFALIVLGAFVIETFVREEDVPQTSAESLEKGEKGQLRVLARPWAEVFVDGQLIDVTPIGRPIPVVPGKHYITFKHPSAPDEKKEIRVAAGQTVVLDVTMRIERAIMDAGIPAPDASAASP